MTDYSSPRTAKKTGPGESTRYGNISSPYSTRDAPPAEFSIDSENHRKDSFFYVTALYSVVFLFVTISFPLYFYFTPDFSASDVRPALLVLYVIMWPIAVIAPVLFLWSEKISSWNTAKSIIYLVAVLGWPLITLVIKIRGLMAFGDAGIGYWNIYPIFILLEVLWPILAVVMWIFSRENARTKLKIRRELRQEFKQALRVREANRT